MVGARLSVGESSILFLGPSFDLGIVVAPPFHLVRIVGVHMMESAIEACTACCPVLA